MKKILVYGLKNVHGGLEMYLLSMQKMLEKEIYFQYLMEECDCIHKDYIETYHGKTFYLPERHGLADYIKTCAHYLKECKKDTNTLYVNINDISIDIVIIIIIGKFYGYRIITHSHNAMMEPIAKLRYRIRHKVLESIGKCILSTKNVTRLAVSERAARYLFGKKDYSCVTPGIYTKKFIFDENTKKRLKKDLDIREKYVIGFVGRIETIKNPFFVLSVFEELVKLNDDVCLLIVGDGTLYNELKEQSCNKGLTEKVRFAGAVDNVNEYFSTIDCLIAPSISEGLGLAVLEAQAAGATVICSDGRFPKEVKQTELLRFKPLNASAKEWANECNNMLIKYTGCDRRKWNQIVFSSDFEINVASEKLKMELLKD